MINFKLLNSVLAERAAQGNRTCKTHESCRGPTSMTWARGRDTSGVLNRSRVNLGWYLAPFGCPVRLMPSGLWELEGD
jgi:hypothetical protein